MKIAVIGSGKMGRALGSIWARAEHEIIFTDAMLTNEQLAVIASEAGPTASYGFAADAAQDADVILLTVRWVDIEAAMQSLGGASGKIILTTVNALKADMSGLAVGTTTSAAEEIAKLAPLAQVVESILPFADVLLSPDRKFGDDRPAVFYCGDSVEAKVFIVPLLEELGVTPVDAGPLMSARYIEPAGMLLVQLAYPQGMGGQIAFKLLNR